MGASGIRRRIGRTVLGDACRPDVGPPPDAVALRERWLALTRGTMPSLAAARDWPVRADHCFQRILLDNACGGCWYDYIAGRPAYVHVAPDILARAVALGEAVIAGETDLDRLNARSIDWRRRRRHADRGVARFAVEARRQAARTSR